MGDLGHGCAGVSQQSSERLLHLHAARAAGMKFIGVQLEGDQGRNISEIAAPHEPVFESLSDMHEWLSQEVFDV